MRAWDTFRLRARSLFAQGAADRDLDDELAYHLELEVQENLRAGMSEADARLAALRRLGGVDQLKEACRDARRVRPLQDLLQDAAYAVRLFRRNRTFAAVSILTLSLGIGATTAIFSVVSAVLLQPLPYKDADRIVALGTRTEQTGRETARVTGGDLVDLEAERGVFDAISAYWGGEIGVQAAGTGEFASVFFVEPSFFRVFGVEPAAGRLFRAADGEQAAVVGEGFAERLFGTPARTLGQRVSVEDQAYTIVGVLPRRFAAPERTDVWLPTPSPLPGIALNRTAFNFHAVARLGDGVPITRARAAANGLSARLAAAFPASNRGRTFTVTPLRDRLVSNVRATLVILLAAVSLVLLIACANVANLLLARATTRGREIGLRAALGASRLRIARQLVAESLVLSLAGGALGLAVASAGTRALVSAAPASLPRLDAVTVDWRVLAFALGCSLVASLLFGLAPAWSTSRLDLNDAMKQASARGVVGGRSNRLRAVLVSGEIALSVVLSVAALVLFRGFLQLTAADLGYRPASVLVAYAHAPAKTLDEYVRVARLFERLSPELTSVPGVRSVGAVMGLPAGKYGSNGEFSIEGRPQPGPGDRVPEAGFRLASPGYFAALGVPLLDGRDFSEQDRHDAPFVAIVSRALARRDFPGENPIGRRIRCGLDAPDKWMTIVGVVGNVRQDSPASVPAPEIYMPLEQHPYHANEVQVVLRTAVDPESVVPLVREKMHRLNATMALKFTTLDRMVSSTLETQRFRTWLFAAFAGLALLLAMAGVYGVIAFLAAQRTSEFGLRLALGATPRSLFGLVVSRAGWLALTGIPSGLVLAFVATRLIASVLPDVAPLGVGGYIAVAGLVALVVLAAAGMPGWTAARVDPMVALREE